jgi:uncharacterized protein (DUF1800 family)
MGQVIFYPPNVAGWPGGSSWINSSALLARLNFANAAARLSATSVPGKTLDQLLGAFVEGNLTASTRSGLEELASAHGNDPATLLYFVLATPEYQLN